MIGAGLPRALTAIILGAATANRESDRREVRRAFVEYAAPRVRARLIALPFAL